MWFLLKHLIVKERTYIMYAVMYAVRATLMTAKALNLNLELIEVDLFAGETRTPEYLKMNPQHTVPTFVDDDGFIIWDSHAIMTYLVSKYSKDDSLYPNDLKKRAVVDQRLHFDSSVISPKGSAIARPIVCHGKKAVTQTDKDEMFEVYEFLEKFLDGKEWIAGDSVTIADFSLIASITSVNILVPVDETKFPRLTAWLKKAETLPVYEENRKGLEKLTVMMKSFLS